MNRSLVIILVCVAIALTGCATSLATRDHAPANDGAASPTTSAAPRPSTNFGSATIPDFGPQNP
jgi:hypothetical protein